jgi:hypothetical protein
MSTAYILRGQGLGIVTDRVYLQWPSQADLEAVMARELELHGFEHVEATVDAPAHLAPCERWVRVQTIEIVDVAPAVPAACGENELVPGKLSPEAAAQLLSGIAAGGAGSGVAASGDIVGQGTAVVGPAPAAV